MGFVEVRIPLPKNKDREDFGKKEESPQDLNIYPDPYLRHKQLLDYPAICDFLRDHRQN